MAVAFVQVCTSWSAAGDGLQACNQLVWQPAYLIPPEAAGYVDLLMTGGFSAEAFGVGAAGVLGSFAIGLLLGWSASLLRKAK